MHFADTRGTKVSPIPYLHRLKTPQKVNVKLLEKNNFFYHAHDIKNLILRSTVIRFKN